MFSVSKFNGKGIQFFIEERVLHAGIKQIYAILIDCSLIS